MQLLPVDFDPFIGPELVYTHATTAAQREVLAAAAWGCEASCAFNECWSLRLGGALDKSALRQALNALVDRHEALRATFTPDGATVCIAAPGADAGLPELDLTALAPAARSEALAAALAAEVEQPFDLVRGPLVRWQLARLDDQESLLLFCAHHLVCDGWSTAVLVKDLAALYSGRPLAAAAARYSDYASWEADRLKGDEARADGAFWRTRFQDGAPELDLPLDGSRPSLKTYASRREDLALPRALLTELKAVGAKSRASLFTVLISGFYAWLHRQTGQDSFVVGVPAAGQATKGEDTLVGHCVNLLPIRIDVRSAEPFAALVARVRTAVLDAYDHQQFTYGQLLEGLPLARDPARLPLVSVMFNVDQGLAASQMPFAGLTVQFSTVPRHFENFELFLNLIEVDGQTTVECQYNSDLFTAEGIRARLASFQVLLTAAAAAPVTPVDRLAVVPPAERTQLLSVWNATSAPIPHGSVAALVSDQAAAAPDRIAVVAGAESLTYRALETRSNQLAHHLRAAGVGRGALVGVSLERTPELLVGLLGILKAGAAYVPVDPTYPPERIRWMIEDARMPLLVTTTATVADLPLEEASARPLCLDTAAAALAKHPGTPVQDPPAPTEPAYVIFTSGSTGRPKGVVVPHRGVVNFLASMRTKPGFSADDTLLAVTTVSFDIHVLELFLPLAAGGTVVLASRDEATDGAALNRLLDAHKATVLQATPATWRMLIAVGWQGRSGFKALVGGEALPRDLAAALLERQVSVWNMYGPTETTVWSTCHRTYSAEGPLPIGKPIANTTVYVVDSHLAPVPTGVAGELLIGGAGVTAGYLGRDELTAEKFIADPFAPSGRLYRTGDLARWRRDGTLECLGRTDHQVKVRGFRIELGDIETALSRHPGVDRAAAGVRERASGDPRLVAWVVAKSGATPAAADLRQSLKGTLPEYMIPQHFVVVPELPLTPNGKIDRKRLPSPFTDGRSGGGNANGAGSPKPSAAITRRADNGPIPVSPQQEWILAFDARTTTALMNLPTAFRLLGPLDENALTRALEALIRRHDTLRTSIRRTPDGFVQTVAPSATLPVTRIDLSAATLAAREAALADDFARLAEERFDLAAAPLLRIRIYRMAPAESVLFMMAHHSIWDGWSFDLFVKELSALYDAFAAGRPDPLPPLAIQYTDFCEWQRAELAAGAFAAQRSYWERQLTPRPATLALPTDRPRPATPSHLGRSLSYKMPRDVANALAAVGKDAGATLFMVVLAAFKALLFRQSGTPDVVVGTPVRGRGEAATEALIGTFVNQVALRTELKADEPFVALLKRVRQVALEGYAHDAWPFGALERELGITAPQAVFSYQDARERRQSFGTLPYQQLNIEPTACAAELSFWVKESHDSLLGSMNYATDLFDEARITQLLAAYNALLHGIVLDPEMPVGELPLALDAPALADVRMWLDGIPAMEAALAAHPAIARTAVVVVPAVAGAARLAAFYAVKPGDYLTATDLRRHLRQALPQGGVPQVVTELPDLPVAAGDRVDKQKLLGTLLPTRAPGGDDAEAGVPKTKAELALAAVWKELLGVERVSTQANFFEQGGHSLLAIQMIAKVEEKTGVKLGRMAVTLNTLGQIAATMGMDDGAAPADPSAGSAAAAAPGSANRGTIPGDIRPTTANSNASPAAGQAPAAAPSLASRLLGRLRRGPADGGGQP
jgi:amino acid adenylation domain-containing protein